MANKTSGKRFSVEMKRFCKMYAKCFDPVKSYAEAYNCALDEAAEKAPELMKKKSIRSKINKLKTAKFNRALIDADDIFEMYKQIAFADINDYLEYGKIVEVDKNGNEIVSNIVNFKNYYGEKLPFPAISNISDSKTGGKITFYDRMKALEWLSKNLSENKNIAAEDHEKTGVIIIPSAKITDNMKGT